MHKPEDVTFLNLSGKNVPFDNLVRFRSLHELNLSDTEFNKADILVSLPYLRRVNLTNTPITDLSSLRGRIISGSLTVIGKDAEVKRVYEIPMKIGINPRIVITIPRSPYQLKILILGLPLSILCGVTSVQKDLARVLVMAGHEVMMLNYFPAAGKDFNLIKCSVEENTLKTETIAKSRDLDVILRNMQSAEFYPDILHAHTHTMQTKDMLDIMLNELENPTLVYTIHDLLPYRQILVNFNADTLLTGGVDPNTIRKAIDLSYYAPNRNPGQIDMIKKADAIVNITQNHQLAMGQIFGSEIGKKTVVIKNTTPLWFILNSQEVLERAKELRQGLHQDNNFVLFYSGRISQEKMIETLMLGFNKICEQYPNTKLLLVGARKKSEDADTVNSLVATYKLDTRFISNIVPTGWIQDLNEYTAYYLAGDILVQPGRTPDNYSIAAIEAMAARKPVISVPGDFSCGIADNPENLCRNVIGVMERYNFYQSYCNEIYVKALDRYGPIRFLNGHLDLYNNVLAENPKMIRLLRRTGKKQLSAIGFLTDITRYGVRLQLDKLRTRTGNLPLVGGIDERHCAEYARIAAERLFGLKYVPADAWDMGRTPGNFVVWREHESKEDYHKVIKPGDLVGIYFRTSPSNKRNRSYTHMAVYLGEGKILQQLVKDIIISDLDKLIGRGYFCALKEIIRTNRKITKAA